MRLGPIAVPVAIAAAFFVIVAAEAGWLDGAVPEPSPVRVATADRPTPHADPAREAPPHARRPKPSAAAASDAAIGRSAGVAAPPPVPVAKLDAGGASLDADGVATASPRELLRQAHEDTAKAQQDVVDVTRAALDAQHASEAEFARQRTELTDQNTQLAADLARARTEAAGLRQQADGGQTDSALRDEAARARTASEAAADALAAARGRTAALIAEVATLRTDAARMRLVLAGQASGAARLRETADGSSRREAALGREIADLRAEADRTRADATVRAAAADAARDAAADTSAATAALRRSEGTVRDLQAKVAALTADVATGRSAARVVPPFEVVGPSRGTADASVVTATLKSDLDGARRGEDTLRKENGMLQRQLADAQASARLLGEKLAALQVGAGQYKPEPLVPRAGPRAAVGSPAGAGEHERMVRQLEALRREQMHVELQGLKIEADGLAGSRPRAGAPGQAARVVTVMPGAGGPAVRRLPRRAAKAGPRKHGAVAVRATPAPPGPPAGGA